MRVLPIKDAFIKFNPDQEEILILGGKTEFNDQELQEIADQFDIKNFSTKLFESRSARKVDFGALQYLQYALVYGSKSPYWEESLKTKN